MHICMLASTHIPLDTRIYRREAKALAGVGHRITIATMSNQEKPEGQNNIDFVVQRCPGNRYKRLFASLRLLRWALSSKADVFHIHDIDILYFAPIIRIFKRKKVIFDAHETFVENFSIKRWIPKLLRPMAALFIKLYEKFNILFVHKVIVPVQIIGKRYGKKAHLVRNFPIIEKDYIDWQKKQEVICYVGAIYKERRIEWMIELAAKLKDYPELQNYTVEIYGPVFPASDIKYYKKLAKDISPDYLKMKLERIPFEKAKEIFASSRFGFCLFADRQRFHLSLPVKVFEYMSFSTIPIISSINALKDYIVHMQNGIFIEYDDEDNLLTNLAKLHHNPQKIESISRKAHKDASEKFNWKMESRRIIDLYSDM